MNNNEKGSKNENGILENDLKLNSKIVNFQYMPMKYDILQTKTNFQIVDKSEK
jgi:hypothetical protein